MKKWFYGAGILFAILSVQRGSALDFVMSQETDLNNDGIVEHIRLTEQPATGEFTVSVGKASITRAFESGEPIDGFIVVDVDENDKYKEIAVHTPGPSDDDEYYLFWYDGTSIHKMAYLSRWPHFYGNGIVNVDAWMGFWTKREKYVLNATTRILDRVPQELYYVGVEANVRKSFPIYRTRTSSGIVANLKPNSTCLILVCDTSHQPMQNWYLVKSVTGLVGWAREDEVFDKLDLPLAD
jgi:hypothetical protein